MREIKRKSEFVLAIIFVTASFCGAENLVVNGGFETTETTGGGWPSIYGDWRGDYSSIVGASDGIVPLEGSQMLKFMGTSFRGASSGNSCQVYQIIDVSSFRELIAAGQATASMSAYFNRVAGDVQTDTEFYVQIHAYEGDPSTFPSRWETYGYDATLAYVDNILFTDSNPATWEQCEVQLALPPNTDFILIASNVTEDIYNDSSYPEFDGHFADAVSVTIVPGLLEGPVSHWEFDEVGGDVAYDSAGNNDGTIYGAERTAGIIGGALSFDGNGDYVLVGDKDSLELQEFTLTFWAKRNNPSGWAEGGIAKGYIFGTPTEFSYRLDFHAGETVAGITNTSDIRYNVYTSMTDSDWHMWTMTVGGGILSIYRDGILTDSTGYTGPIDYTKSHNNFVIGARDNGNYAFNGLIDDVRVYDGALSAEEIQQLYQDGLSGPGLPIDLIIAVKNIEGSIVEKLKALERIDTALAKEQAAVESLNELLASEDYGDLNQWDVLKARWKIRFAIWRQKHCKAGLQRSIGRLEDSLILLGCEVELQSWPESETEMGEGVIKADINADGVVDFRDLATVMQYWLESYEEE